MADANPAKSGAPSKIDVATEQSHKEMAKTEAASAEKVADAVEAGEPKPDAKAAAVKAAVKTSRKTGSSTKAAAAKSAPTKSAKKRSPAKASIKKAPAAKGAAGASTEEPSKPSARIKNTKTAKPSTNRKETNMATSDKNDMTATAKEFAADMQDRLKTAYEKSGEFAGEMGDFQKGNIEAMVESGKIFFNGAQELVHGHVDAGKTMMETLTEDAKKMASMSSPTGTGPLSIS